MVIQQILYILLIFASLSAHGLNLRVNDPEKCAILCTSCDGAPSFIDDQCECQIADANEQGAECITNLQKSLDSNPNLVDHIDLNEERSARCTLGSRRHLVKEDANKVAKYFLNGGPAAGVTHFIPSTYQQPVPETEEDCDDSSNESDDSDDFNSDTVAAANPTSQSKQSSKNIKGQFVDNTAYKAIQAPSYALPAIPTILGSPQYLIPHTLPAARFKPRLHPLPGLLHLQTLQNIPQHLFRFAKLPVQSLVGLSNIITHGLTSSGPPYYNGVEQNVLGSTSTNQVNELSTQSTVQDHDTEIEKSRNRQGVKNIFNRRRTGATTKKQNTLQEENIVGAPIPVYTQTAQHRPFLHLTNPTYEGYFLQLIPGDQHNALPNIVVGSPYTENLPLCRDPKFSNVILSKSDSSQTDDVDESTDNSTNENDKKTNDENIRITRHVSDERIKRR